VSRLPRAENDLFSRHPQRIVRALQVGDLDFHSYGVLSFFVNTIALPGRDNEAIFTLAALAEALQWPYSPQWLREKLKVLRRQGWIEFEQPRRGPAAAYVFRLSGAAIDAKQNEFATNFKLEHPSQFETNSNSPRVSQAANPLPHRFSVPPEFQSGEVPREEKRGEEIFSEGNYDHDVGKTTAAGERERAFLADCQTLVDAGLARWREDDDGSEWR
jgi:hypothetical protein